MEQPNLSYIDTLSGDDKAFKEKMISIIKAEFPEEKAVYFKNIEAKNFNEASENVHKLKHKISILGLEKSYEVATDYENNLKNNHDDAEKETFKIILENMTNFLDTL
ncbi:Hpt domain-containing protein [Flavivirga jejuensis]|uniref:Hpt domain-containing protein n=1 Tax=Flavivirga jejuensis TaxID=870487 RepID=A0ABT8WQC9_9FLAO|nr:Hpt domain-containing protein [Flavivirga jejuensis]MDO5975117.1 Hpt domain-containing protein [Flavivirga jejuensis]